MDGDNAGRVKFHAQPAGRLQEPFEEPRSMAWTREETKVNASKKMTAKMARQPGKNSKSVEDVGHFEEGDRARKGMFTLSCLRFFTGQVHLLEALV